MSNLTPRQHALRVAAQEALLDAVSSEYAKIRAEAEEVFAVMLTEDGTDRIAVMLPDGEKLDRITVKVPASSAVMNGGPDALLDWCRDHFLAAIEEYIDPAKVGSLDVIAAVRDKVPGAIRTRVRPGTAKALMKEIEDSGGLLADRVTRGESQVATVTEGVVTGAFSFTGNNTAQRRERIMAELLAGRLQGVIGFGPIALPAPEVPAEPEPEPAAVTAPEPDEADAVSWQVVLESGHWNCGGWSVDGRDGALVCSCGTVLRESASAATS